MKKFKLVGPWLRKHDLVHSRGMYVVLAAHFAVLTAMILVGGGVPYVMDNNETFSSLNHAYNLWHFDFFRSIGLADEAVSPHASAHPIVHTHQGNFPRLFAFVLYVLGAHSPESQIWITSFTIGTVTVLFAFIFFRRVTGELFATIATLLLVTDYLLFAQWQVNTYRVWHGFFLFGALLCVHGLTAWKRGWWIAATFLLYLGLFYGELVIAAFTAVSAAIYAAFQYWRRPRLLLFGWVIAGVGAACGVALVLLQLVAYLGWQDFLTDLRLTSTARNFAPSDTEFLRTLHAFYDTRNIAFFYNLGRPQYDTALLAIAHSLYAFVLQINTAVFASCALVLALAGFMADTRLPDRSDALVAHRAIGVTATATLLPGIVAFVFILFAPVRPSFIVLIALAVALGLALRPIAAAVSSTQTAPAIRRSAQACMFFFGAAAILMAQSYFSDAAGRAFSAASLPLPDGIAVLPVLASALLGGVLILAGRQTVLGPWSPVPGAIAPFLISGAIAYAVVYQLNPGYVISGYLGRLCPLPVFHVNTLLALGPFILIAMALRLIQRPRQIRRWTRSGFALTAGALAAILFGSWSFVQWRHAEMLPPSQIRFIKLLRAYRGADPGIVSNNYAIPFGYVARTWAYTDFTLTQMSSAPRNERTTPYLWLADRGTNRAYSFPELYVCFEAISNITRLIALATKAQDAAARCSALPIVHRALERPEPANAVPQLALLARDEAQDRWAVIRLRWPTASAPADPAAGTPTMRSIQ